jgi:putative ABC transport system permease protein
MILAVRTTGDAAALARSVREAVGTMDAQLPVYNLRTMRDVVAGTISAPRLATNLSGALAALALTLAAVGLYGVLAFTVGQRTREIGVRMALGATANGVVRMVLRDAALLAVAGIGAGLAMAFGAVALLKSQLFGVAPVDPLIFASVPVVFVGVAMLASTVPALRAARVSPMEALRGE